MLGRQYDRRRFCRVFWRQSGCATSLLWGCGHSIPAAGNTWLPAPLLPEHCHLPHPRGRQLSRQLTGQNSVCSIERLIWLLLWCLGPRLISKSVDGWELHTHVCVCSGLEQGFDMLADMKNQRSRTRAMETVSELALGGNTWGHSNKNRCTFLLLFRRNNPHPLHASNGLWSKDWGRSLGPELLPLGPSRSQASQRAGALPGGRGWSPYWSTWRVGPSAALRGYK